MTAQAALDAWSVLLGAANVLQPHAAQAEYGQDTSACIRRIAGALRIMDAALLPETIRIAAAFRVPVYPISTGKNWGYGSALPAAHDCVILDLSALRRIIHFDGELGTVTVEPGVTQGMLADFLAEGRHPFLVPVTGAGPHCSLMGNALERGFGITPHTDHWGAVTDLEAVLSDGSLYRTALREAAGDELARLFKWGIGPYSAGLFAQSGFGIVTRLTILLARKPECAKACFFRIERDEDLEEVMEQVRQILRCLPGLVGGVNLMNQRRV